MYLVLGDLLSGMRSLRQVFDQLATVHASNRPLAFDEYGDHAAGSAGALAAADELDRAEDPLNVGVSAADRIADLLDTLTLDRTRTIRVEVHEADGSTFTDIIHASHTPRAHPHDETDDRPRRVRHRHMPA